MTTSSKKSLVEESTVNLEEYSTPILVDEDAYSSVFVDIRVGGGCGCCSRHVSVIS